MPILALSDDQVIELVKELSEHKKQELLKLLLLQPWESWTKLTHDGPEKARQAAQLRGKNWDAMTEDEREEFIDELLHEDNKVPWWLKIAGSCKQDPTFDEAMRLGEEWRKSAD